MRDVSSTWDFSETVPPLVGTAIVGVAILTSGPVITGSMTVTAVVGGTLTGEQTITGTIQ